MKGGLKMGNFADYPYGARTVPEGERLNQEKESRRRAGLSDKEREEEEKQREKAHKEWIKEYESLPRDCGY